MNRSLKNFLELNSYTQKIIESYIEVREEFQRLGFSEEDLKNPPSYTSKMFLLQNNITDGMSKLIRDAKDFGVASDKQEIIDYFVERFGKINELKPLSNVSKKRTNSWDEDSE